MVIIEDTILFRVITAGGRKFDNYELLKTNCDYYLQNKNNIEIVSGGAVGADGLGEQYARERGYQIKRFIPDWSHYKKRAGFIRNEDMAQYADALIAFWDGISKGSKHMIDVADLYKLPFRVIRY